MRLPENFTFIGFNSNGVNGHVLKQQLFVRSNLGNAHESSRKHIVVQSVVDCAQTHSLMMRHIAFYNCKTILFSRPVIERFIKPVFARRADLAEQAQVLRRCFRFNGKCKHACIRCNNIRPHSARCKRKFGIAESTILIAQGIIERIIPGFRHTPRFFRRGSKDLRQHRIAANLKLHTVRYGFKENQRHQILKHRPAPAFKYAPARSIAHKARKRKPMLRPNPRKRNCRKTRQSAF